MMMKQQQRKMIWHDEHIRRSVEKTNHEQFKSGRLEHWELTVTVTRRTYIWKILTRVRWITISSMGYTWSEICLLYIMQMGTTSPQFYQCMNWSQSTTILKASSTEACWSFGTPSCHGVQPSLSTSHPTTSRFIHEWTWTLCPQAPYQGTASLWCH
jgi:hypothetical protein